jgi:hypothetical protein
MNLTSTRINEYDNFENEWGFYVDLENPHIPISKYGFVNGKYNRNCYNCYDKIDEELEYYEYEYNKKKEEQSKKVDDSNQIKEAIIIKTNSLSLIFNISSVTLITAALSYCFLAAL